MTTMDPDANLADQLGFAQEIQKVWDDCNADGTLTPSQAEHVAAKAKDLAELVIALDGWLRQGGYLPKRWNLGGKP